MTYREAPFGGARLTLAARTETGPIRMVNEDGFLVLDLATGVSIMPEPGGERLESGTGVALAVIDGMGGCSGGTEATRIAIEAMRRRLRAGVGRSHEGLRRAMVEAVKEAGREVHRAAQRDRVLTGIGAALTAAAIGGGAAQLVHLGDTRAYLLRGGRLEQLTRDDSLLNDAHEYGIKGEELENLPRNVITKALGIKEEVEPSGASVELSEGDTLLLCSDGVHGVVSDAAIEALLRASPDPAAACAALIDGAIGAGSSDNLTAVVVRVELDGQPREAAPIAGGEPILVEVASHQAVMHPARSQDQLLTVDLAGRGPLDPLPPALFSATPGVALAALRALPANDDAAAAAAVRATAHALRGKLLADPRPEGSAAWRARLAEAARDAAAAAYEAAQGGHKALVSLTAALIAGAELHLAHVGAGRAYVLRRGRLAAVTRDDTLINEAGAQAQMRAQGMSDADIAELMELQGRHVLVRTLGSSPDIAITVETIGLREGDVLALGTEGFALGVPEEALSEVLRAHRPLQEACRALLEPARWHGRRDDVSAIVAKLRGPGLSPPGEGDALAGRNEPAWRPEDPSNPLQPARRR